MPAEVLYTRVPGELKAAVETYAVERAQSTSACVSELLNLGFEAATKTRSIAALSARVAELESELALARTKLGEAEERDAAFRGAATSWASRAERPMGTCAECKASLRGSDFLVTGACPKCGANIVPRLEKANGLAEPQWYLLAGAAGVVLGMLLMNAAKS